MINTNTYEAFRQTDPEAFIDDLGKDVMASILDRSCLEKPWKLSLFLVLAYSDLKRYRFHYWVAHPTPLKLPEMYYEEPPRTINEEFTVGQDLCDGFLQLDSGSKNYFSVLLSRENEMSVADLAAGVRIAEKIDEPQVLDAFQRPMRYIDHRTYLLVFLRNTTRCTLHFTTPARARNQGGLCATFCAYYSGIAPPIA